MYIEDAGGHVRMHGYIMYMCICMRLLYLLVSSTKPDFRVDRGSEEHDVLLFERSTILGGKFERGDEFHDVSVQLLLGQSTSCKYSALETGIRSNVSASSHRCTSALRD